MTRTACLIRCLPAIALLAAIDPVFAQEDKDEVRARATWRPQAPELKELPPGVERRKEAFKVERPKSSLPGFERPESDVGQPEEAPAEPAVDEAAEPAPAPRTAEEPEAASPVDADPDAADTATEPATEEAVATREAVDGEDATVPAEEPLEETTVPRQQAPATAEVATTRDPDRQPPAPRSNSMVQPRYPEDALVDGVEGYVALEFTVTERGQVRDVAIVDSEPRGVFESSVREAIRRWRFEPARENGRPVDQRVRHRFDFNMDGG